MSERYWVEGSDGNRYGPADLATLKGWVTEGRLQPTSFLVSESSGERVRADAVPGLFGTTVEGPPPVAPPRMGTAPGPAPKKSNSTLIIVLAVVLGMCALGVPILAAILFPVFSQAKYAAQKTRGLSNVKQLSLGVLIYGGDFDDRFPTHMESVEAMQPYIDIYLGSAKPDVYKVANPNGGELLGDKRLSGRSSVSLLAPQDAVMIRDSVAWPRGEAMLAFADGHAKSTKFDMVAAMMQPDPFGGLTREQEDKDLAP